MSSPKHYMPMYWGDYLADTAHLTTTEHGAYLLLIAHYWRTGALPADDGQVARITRMSASEWRRSRSTLAAFFGPDWTHERIEKEIAASRTAYAKRVEGARITNARRDAERNGERHAERSAVATQPEPEPEREGIEPSLGKTRARGAARLPDDWKPNQNLLEFANSEGLHDAELTREIQRFCDYWSAAGGQRARKCDWSATFRVWVRKWADDRRKPHGGAPQRPDTTARNAHLEGLRLAVAGRIGRDGD